MGKRLISLLLAVVLVLSLAGLTTAFAVEGDEDTSTETTVTDETEDTATQTTSADDSSSGSDDAVLSETETETEDEDADDALSDEVTDETDEITGESEESVEETTDVTTQETAEEYSVSLQSANDGTAVAASDDGISLTAISGDTTVAVGGSITLTGSSGNNHSWTYTSTDGGAVSFGSTNSSSVTVTGVTAGTVVITHSYRSGRDTYTEAYTVTVSSTITVYVFVSGFVQGSNPKEYFSGDMLTLLNVSELDSYGYFAAGTIELDMSQLSGTTESKIASTSEWTYVISVLASSLNTSTSLTDPNNLIAQYASYIQQDIGYTQGQGYSGLWLAGGHSNIEDSGGEVNVQYWHLDIRFETVNITYINGNNGIDATESETYADGVQLSKGVFIKGVTLTNAFEPSTGAPEGYEFAGFYEDEELTKEWTGYGNPITEDTTVYLKYVPKKINVTVEKVWDDSENANNTRPNDITVTLYQNGSSLGTTYAATLNEENEWTYTFEGLPAVVQGEMDLLQYTAVEDTVSHYTVTYDKNAVKYSSSSDADYTYTITNTLNEIPITITKQVTGNMGDTTKSFSITLNDGTKDYTYDLTSGNSSDAIYLPVGTTVTISESGATDYTMTVTYNGQTYDKDTGYTFVLVDGQTAITVTNDKTVTPDTGITLDTLPFVLILTASLSGLGLVVINRKRRDSDG